MNTVNCEHLKLVRHPLSFILLFNSLESSVFSSQSPAQIPNSNGCQMCMEYGIWNMGGKSITQAKFSLSLSLQFIKILQTRV